MLSKLEGSEWVRGKSVQPVHIRRAGDIKFHILGPATLKLWAPNELWTNGMKTRNVWQSLAYSPLGTAVLPPSR